MSISRAERNPTGYIQCLNFFGHQTGFKINRADKYNTKVGILCSITLMLVVSMIIVYFGISYIDRSNPVVQYNEYTGGTYFEIPYATRHILLRFGILTIQGMSGPLPAGRLHPERIYFSLNIKKAPLHAI